MLLVASCGSPERTALRELSRAGIQPSGRALVDSVTLDEPEQVAWLLTLKVHTEQRDSLGRTPLRIAIEQGRQDFVTSLLAAGADVNATTTDGTSPLAAALGAGESQMTRELIAAGASPSARMAGGEKILPWCIRNGRPDFAREMIAQGADPHLKDDAGIPLLHIAIAAGQKDLVEALIAHGADPGSTDSQGRGTLALATENGWTGLLPSLAAAGADPNLSSPAGFTLLDKAIAGHDTELIPLLMEIGADPVRKPTVPGGMTPLEAAIAGGHAPTLRAVLRPGETLGGPEWEPALWLAYDQGNRDLAVMLLGKGARAKRPGPHGLLIAEVAASAGKTGWLKLFLDYGHSPGAAVFRAVTASDRLTASFLLKNGADPNRAPVPYVDTPLSLALRQDDGRLATLLLRHGARADFRLPEGQKLLHLAIVTGKAGVVRELLASGADPNEPITLPVSQAFLQQVPSKDMRWYLAKDRNVTPLMLAANSGNIATARHLLAAGAKKNTYTRKNYTWPINFASRRGDVRMMKLLLGQDPDKIRRHIILSLGEQRARVFDGGGQEIFSTKVSSGKTGYRTRQGEFVITDKHRTHNSSIYGSSMPYFQRLSCSDFGFHYGNVPGYPASHGCIRLPMSSAKALFAMTEVGDTVTIQP